ncbi:hypothetical protein [Pseudorhodoferax sp.]|uniref:hypothetical protein n=1 Tax=Pseudorhodoferax sp. TaxID=1993553 RepID=UPI0039E34286
MKNTIAPYPGVAPYAPAMMPLGVPLRASGAAFAQGFVAAGCLSAFQDRQTLLSSPSPVELKRVLRHALQGGAALAAGTRAAAAFQQQDYARMLVATAAGAAGVLIIERLLRDAAQAEQENQDG